MKNINNPQNKNLEQNCHHCFYFENNKQGGFLLVAGKHKDIYDRPYYLCDNHYNQQRIQKIIWEYERKQKLGW